MLFKQRFHQGLIDGSITETFRSWVRPRVKIGGQYRLNANGVIEVDAIATIAPDSITDSSARKAGFQTTAELLAALGPLDDGASLFRIAFHYIALKDGRIDLASDDELTAVPFDAIAAKLAKMDNLSKHGPWTAQTLAIIDEHPRVAASRLADVLARDKLPFKSDVRKLKNLGLTISFDVGYELSPRGRAFLAHERDHGS